MLARASVTFYFALFAVACASPAGASTQREPDDATAADTTNATSTPNAPTVTTPPNVFGELVPAAESTPLAQALAEATGTSDTQAIRGRIGKVCQNKGCWMTLHDGDAIVRVETGHRFVIPAGATGDAVVYGTLKRSVLGEDRAAHLRSESLDVAAGEGWMIDANGVRILK